MRGWWRVGGHEGEVSRSMVALVVSLVAALGLGLWSWVPQVFDDVGVVDTEPGLLQVAQGARGVQSLGADLTVSLYDAGFRLSRGSTVLADTVTRGAPVTAVEGRLEDRDGQRREHVAATLSNARIDAVTRDGTTVTYAGIVYDEATSRPLWIAFSASGGRIHMRVGVEGADALVVHLDWRPATVGIEPALPERNLRKRAWWVDPSAVQLPTFTWILGTDVSIAPVGVQRAVDLRQDGRIALHVWAPRAVVTVTDTPRPS